MTDCGPVADRDRYPPARRTNIRRQRFPSSFLLWSIVGRLVRSAEYNMGCIGQWLAAAAGA